MRGQSGLCNMTSEAAGETDSLAADGHVSNWSSAAEGLLTGYLQIGDILFMGAM